APDNGMADIACPDCGTRGQWTEPQEFSGLVKTFLGPGDSETGLHYLRTETAQGIFVNLNNVLTAARKKPAIGIGQIGKAFRNEITPGNFIFRTREFEQMEIEYFVSPDEADDHYKQWVEDCWDWFLDLGISADNVRRLDVPAEARAHYSSGTINIEYRSGFHGAEGGKRMAMPKPTNHAPGTRPVPARAELE